MKIAQHFLITAGLLSSFTVTVLAQPSPAEGQRSTRMEKMHERMAHRHDKHLGELKVKLNLQTDQEGTWATFAQAMQPPTKPMARPDRIALEKLTTPERIDQLQAFKAQRDAHMQKRADATRAFYASLNPDQKKTFDAETAKFIAQGMGQGMSRGHGMPH